MNIIDLITEKVHDEYVKYVDEAKCHEKLMNDSLENAKRFKEFDEMLQGYKFEFNYADNKNS